MRDIAVQIASVDLSDDEPSEEQVKQYVLNQLHELQKARERGLVVPPSVSVFADPRMLLAANRAALSCMRLRMDDGSEVLFSPPPASYVLGSMAEEIERAANEAVDTQELPTLDVTSVKAS